MSDTSGSILDAAIDAEPSTLAIRQAAFRAILSGIAIDEARVAEITGLDTALVGSTVDRLVAAGIATTDTGPAGERSIDGSEGLTVRASKHAISISGSDLHTWCAFDVVGIPAALGLDASGSTRCPTCGGAIELEVRKGEVVDSGAIGWWPSASGGPVIEAFCPSASIFCNSEHLDEWRTANQAEGTARTLVELAEAGRETWSSFRA
ncbi:MAG: organomercurial lyase [Actinomycetota bacterium]|nr:organomercurial lyase [Actinomycetota bacterium]MDA8210241.1 organomercurial lyase [Actinomycetota bacterium]